MDDSLSCFLQPMYLPDIDSARCLYYIQRLRDGNINTLFRLVFQLKERQKRQLGEKGAQWLQTEFDIHPFDAEDIVFCVMQETGHLKAKETLITIDMFSK